MTKRIKAVDDGRYSELYTIAVAEACQGFGIGIELMRQFELELANRGAEIITLTTDSANNDKALHFYKKLGYSIFYEFVTRQGRSMYRLRKSFEVN